MLTLVRRLRRTVCEAPKDQLVDELRVEERRKDVVRSKVSQIVMLLDKCPNGSWVDYTNAPNRTVVLDSTDLAKVKPSLLIKLAKGIQWIIWINSDRYFEESSFTVCGKLSWQACRTILSSIYDCMFHLDNTALGTSPSTISRHRQR